MKTWRKKSVVQIQFLCQGLLQLTPALLTCCCVNRSSQFIYLQDHFHVPTCPVSQHFPPTSGPFLNWFVWNVNIWKHPQLQQLVSLRPCHVSSNCRSLLLLYLVSTYASCLLVFNARKWSFTWMGLLNANVNYANVMNTNSLLPHQRSCSPESKSAPYIVCTVRPHTTSLMPHSYYFIDAMKV